MGSPHTAPTQAPAPAAAIPAGGWASGAAMSRQDGANGKGKVSPVLLFIQTGVVTSTDIP